MKKTGLKPVFLFLTELNIKDRCKANNNLTKNSQSMTNCILSSMKKESSLPKSPTLPKTPKVKLQLAGEALHKVRQVTRSQEVVTKLITTSTPQQLAVFYQEILYLPPKSTLLKSTKNKQLNELICKHLPDTPATDKCHMIQKQSSVQSTHNNRQEILDTRKQVDDMNPPQEA